MSQVDLSFVELAIKSYRNKTSSPLILLPRASEDGFEVLLHVAAGDEAWIKLATTSIDIKPLELKKAALQLVTQLCFDKPKDAYGVLGLHAGASEARIKTHYRLMIRLFHPDRSKLSTQKTKAYAAEVNRAMEEIRSISSQPIKKTRSHNVSSRPPLDILVNQPKYPHPDSPFFKRLRETILNYGLLALIVLVSLMLVAMYMWREAHPVLKPEDSRFYGETNPTLQEAPHEDTLSQAKEPLSASPSSETNPPSNTKEISVVEAPLKPSIENESHELKVKKEIATQKTKSLLPNVIKEAVIKKETLPEDNVSKKIVDVEPSMPETKNEPLRELKNPIPQEKILSQKEMRDLVYDFVDDYNRGKLDAMMQLISENLHTDHDMSKESWRLYYEKLFHETSKREMFLRNLQFDELSQGMKAKTHYESKLFYGNNQTPKIVMGVLEIEAHIENAQPKITLLMNRTLGQ